MNYILLIDTSGDNGFVALGRDGQLVARRQGADARNYAATLNLQVEEVLAEAGITLKDLAAVAVCGGPGSYTGLRIGLSTAKGYCYVLDKPLMLHSKLLLLVVAQYYKHLLKYDNYTAVLPARDKEFFIASYSNNLHPITEPRHVFEGELAEVLAPLKSKKLLTGLANALPAQLLEECEIDIEHNDVIDVNSWMRYAFEQFNCNGFVNLANAEPFYLKQVYTHKSNKINDLSK